MSGIANGIRAAAALSATLLVLRIALAQSEDEKLWRILAHVDASRPEPAVVTLAVPIDKFERAWLPKKFASRTQRLITTIDDGHCVYSVCDPPTYSQSFGVGQNVKVQEDLCEQWRYPTYTIYRNTATIDIRPWQNLRSTPYTVIGLEADDGSGLSHLRNFHAVRQGSKWLVTGIGGSRRNVEAIVNPAVGYLAEQVSVSPGEAELNTTQGPFRGAAQVGSLGGEAVFGVFADAPPGDLIRYGGFQQLQPGLWIPTERQSFQIWVGLRDRSITAPGKSIRIVNAKLSLPKGGIPPCPLLDDHRTLTDNRAGMHIDWSSEDLKSISESQILTPDALLPYTIARNDDLLAGGKGKFRDPRLVRRATVGIISCLVATGFVVVAVSGFGRRRVRKASR